MKRVMAAIVLILTVSCMSFGQAKPRRGTTPRGLNAIQEVTALEREWLEAALQYNVAWYERNLAATYSSTDENGTVSGKAGTIADVRSKAWKPASCSIENLKVRVYGDAAVATGLNVIRGTYRGKNVTGRYPWTDTWVRIGGRWQCVASHNSKLASK